MWDWTVRVVTVVRDVVQWFTQFKVITWAAGTTIAAFIAIKTYSFFMDAAKGIIGLTRTLMAFIASALLIPMLITATAQQSAATGAGTGGAGIGANALAATGALVYATAGPSIGGSMVSNSNNTNVTVPNIKITTSDPLKAGQSVREELNKANPSSVPNGQSAVLL